jgi:hypothetical protein
MLAIDGSAWLCNVKKPMAICLWKLLGRASMKTMKKSDKGPFEYFSTGNPQWHGMTVN